MAPRSGPGAFRDSLASPPAPSSAATAAGTARAAARTTGATLGLWPCLVHDQVAVTEQPSVEHLDGFGCFLLGRHLDEAEAPRPPGELVGDDADGRVGPHRHRPVHRAA